MFGFLKRKKPAPAAVPAPTVAEHFEYSGYKIPMDLLISTGGGPGSFQGIIDEHMNILRSEVGIFPDSHVVEIGCGIGRDAMPLSQIIGTEGSYLGIDVIQPSIQFCIENITKRYPNFHFAHFDVYEGLYNPTGKFRLQELTIPAADNSIDVIILHSVFTHMMEDDIMHYLKEFARILKPTGKVLATFFVVDDKIRESAQVRKYLSFNHKRSPDCYIEDLSIPTRAVGYTEAALRSMVTRAGLKLSRPICFGFWSGHHPAPHYGGQDALIMQRDI